VVNSDTAREVLDFSNLLRFGTELLYADSDEYWTHLMLIDTTEVLPLHKVFVTAHTSGTTSTYDDFLIEVEVLEGTNFAPGFKGGLRRAIVLDWAGEDIKQTYTLPEVVDNNDEAVEMEVMGYSDLHFVNFDKSSGKFTFDKYTQEDEGNYTISILLTDERGKETEETIRVTVMQLTEIEEKEERVHNIRPEEAEDRGDYLK